MSANAQNRPIEALAVSREAERYGCPCKGDLSICRAAAAEAQPEAVEAVEPQHDPFARYDRPYLWRT